MKSLNEHAAPMELKNFSCMIFYKHLAPTEPVLE